MAILDTGPQTITDAKGLKSVWKAEYRIPMSASIA